MGISDFIMIYGDPTYKGNLKWLTSGVTKIPYYKNLIAIILGFPSVMFYFFGLYGINYFVKDNKNKKRFLILSFISLTPYLCLHLLYVMILYLFSFGINMGYQNVIYILCENMFNHFSIVVIIGEIIIVSPFIYLFYLGITNKMIYGKLLSINNPVFIFVILKLILKIFPESAINLALTNALMNEVMLLFFIVLLIYENKRKIKGL